MPHLKIGWHVHRKRSCNQNRTSTAMLFAGSVPPIPYNTSSALCFLANSKETPSLGLQRAPPTHSAAARQLPSSSTPWCTAPPTHSPRPDGRSFVCCSTQTHQPITYIHTPVSHQPG
jgi:hypothetical protein